MNTLQSAVKNPVLSLRKVQQFSTRILGNSPNLLGIDVVKKDWDTLIILDACRADLFRDYYSFDGELSTVTSRGSSTVEWLQGSFSGRTLNDTVYITANPQFSRHQKELQATFHAEYQIWQDEWNDKHDTVLPESVTDAALEAAKNHPRKRLLVHYIQPHIPFIGSEFSEDEGHLNDANSDDLHIWMKKMTGITDLSRQDLWDAYRSNLEIALPEVKRLVDELSGKTVVSSDHGNMFGERTWGHSEWGHPSAVHTKELLEVPWLELPYSTRRKVSAGETTESQSVANSNVTERLKSLGYQE